jgi:hypothetical protein
MGGLFILAVRCCWACSGSVIAGYLWLQYFWQRQASRAAHLFKFFTLFHEFSVDVSSMGVLKSD